MSDSTRSSAAARLIDELDLAGQVHLGRTDSVPLRRLSCGIAAIDALFAGGLPCGRVSEISGPQSAGKTSLLLTLLATATQRGEVVACVDVADALHPPSVAAAGADLRRLLWVRPPSAKEGLRCAELLLQAGGFAVVALDFGSIPTQRLRANVWPRLMRAAEVSQTPLLILAPYRVAGSFSALALQLRQRTTVWQRGLWPLFDGLELSAQLTRHKLGAEGQGAERQGVRGLGVKGLRAAVLPNRNPVTP